MHFLEESFESYTKSFIETLYCAGFLLSYIINHSRDITEVGMAHDITSPENQP